MKIMRKRARKITSILIVSLLFLVPVSLQACDESQESQHSCCCCCEDSSQFHIFNQTEEHDCGCQLNEKKQVEVQPVIFTSQQNIKPEITLFISEFEFNSKDFSREFRGINSHIFSQFSKGPPLYILNSSFII